MINIFRITSKLSSRFLSSPISHLPIYSLSQILTHKQPNPNPIITPSSSTIHTSNQHSLRNPDLDDACESITNLEEAVALFNRMLQMEPKPTEFDFTTFFRSVIKMEHYFEVVIMFKELVRLGFPVHEYIMKNVIYCYAHLKEVELSFGIVGFFLKRGYVVNIGIFNCMIMGFFLKGKLVTAIDLFKSLIKGNLCEINEYTIGIVLNGLAKSGYIGNAVELLQISEKKDWKINAVAYSVVIDGLCKDAMLEEAMDLLLRMVDRGILPNVVTYTCFIHGLLMNGKLDFGFDVFYDLPSKGICPNVITYTVMIQGLCRQRLFKHAKEMLDKMEQFGCFPSSVTYNVIIQACLRHLDTFDSINLLKHITGKDFQLDAASFFMSLRQIQGVRQMKGVCDEEIVNQLMHKLVSSSTIYDLRRTNDKFVIGSLIRKLNSSDGRCRVY